MKKTVTMILLVALCVLVPISAFANGGLQTRMTNTTSYKAANSFFKMPSSMYANPHTSIDTATIPTVFFTVDANGSQYWNMDIGLAYADGGWRFEYLGNSSARSGANFQIWSPGTGTRTYYINSKNASETYGLSDVVLSYTPSQVLQFHSYVISYSGGLGLVFDVYNSSSTLIAQAIVPIKTDFGNAINSGARWNRQFALASNLPYSVYAFDGSYAFNAQWQQGWVINTSGTWIPWNDSVSKFGYGFEESGGDISKIMAWTTTDGSGYAIDNIGYYYNP